MLAFASSFSSSFIGANKSIAAETCIRRGLRMAATNVATDLKVTLYGTPISNYTARCKYVMKRKELPQEIAAYALPADLGGLKCDEYMKLNPLGKMPIIVIEKGGSKEALFESSIICEYLAETFNSSTPSFIPDAPEARAKARLIANLLDIYIGPLHPLMYKPMEGVNRKEGVAKMNQGFDAIEHVLDSTGPFATGKELSIADCCLWGNFPFYDFMLPTFFGWHPTDGRPKLKAWRENMMKESQAARDTYADVFISLYGWWDSGRWEKLSMEPLTPKPELPFNK